MTTIQIRWTPATDGGLTTTLDGNEIIIWPVPQLTEDELLELDGEYNVDPILITGDGWRWQISNQIDWVAGTTRTRAEAIAAAVDSYRAGVEAQATADEQCHHGLSAWLCADPINHYPQDH